MTGPNREREPHRLPFDLNPRARPYGAAIGYAIHPDTFAKPNPQTVTPDSPHTHQPDLFDKYPMGVLSMMDIIMPKKNHAPAETVGKDVHLEPHVDELFARASHTDAGETRSLHVDAAIAARTVYEVLSAQGQRLTEPDVLKMAFHAEIALKTFIDTGEISDARGLGAAILNNLAIPRAIRDRVRKRIESLRENA